MPSEVLEWTLLIFGGAFLVWAGWRLTAGPYLRQIRLDLLARNRARETELAATAASLETGAYAPETVRAAVIALVQDARELSQDTKKDARQPERISGRGPIGKWARLHTELLSSWPAESPRVDLLRIVSHGEPDGDLVVVRVRLRGRRFRSGTVLPDSPKVDERWDLRRVGGDWHLVAFSPNPLTHHLLTAPQIISRSCDSELMARESRAEIAHRTAVAKLADVVVEAGVRQQLGDLSIVDDRFSEAAIRSALVNLISSWETAQLGNEGLRRLAEFATDSVVHELMYPKTVWADAHFSLTDAALREWQPVSLVVDNGAILLTIDLSILALRYLARAVGTRGPRPPGDRRHPRLIYLQWTMRATDAESAWQLVRTSNPAAAVIRGGV